MTNDAMRRQPPAQSQTYVRRASPRGTSFVAANGSFTAVIATATPVRRHDQGEDYLEVLKISPKAVRLERLKSGSSPVLDSHRSGSVRDQIGMVRDARIENGELVVDAALSGREDVQPIAADFLGGTPANVSVGYRVYASTTHRNDDGMLVVTATDWEPFEVSLVAIPADHNTHVRNQKGTRPMADINDTTTADAEHDGELMTRTALTTQTAMSVREVSEAYTIASRHKLSTDFVRQHIDAGGTMQAFREQVFERLASAADKTRSSAIGSDTFDNPEFLGRSISEALHAKMTGAAPSTDAGRELAGRSMLDLGAMILQSQGERVSWQNRNALADRILTRAGGAHTTSDFPMLLASAGNRVMATAYDVAQTPLKALARRRVASDFRGVSVLRLSEAARLTEVLEGGEIKYGSRGEAKEGFAIKTYAQMLMLSRNAIINDDLGAFADMSAAFGRAAATTESDLIAALLLANSGNGAKLDDGNPVYSTTRGNKAATGTALTVDALSDGRRALRDMKDIDGKTPISVTPAHLVVGSAKETEAEKVLHELSAVQVDQANPFAGKLTLHVEPRLAGNAWRLFADPAQITTMVIAYLAGREGPQIDVREGWNVLGAEFRAVLDFGCAMQDWRGTYLNPGN